MFCEELLYGMVQVSAELRPMSILELKRSFVGASVMAFVEPYSAINPEIGCAMLTLI